MKRNSIRVSYRSSFLARLLKRTLTLFTFPTSGDTCEKKEKNVFMLMLAFFCASNGIFLLIVYIVPTCDKSISAVVVLMDKN